MIYLYTFPSGVVTGFPWLSRGPMESILVSQYPSAVAAGGARREVLSTRCANSPPASGGTQYHLFPHRRQIRNVPHGLHSEHWKNAGFFANAKYASYTKFWSVTGSAWKDKVRSRSPFTPSENLPAKLIPFKNCITAALVRSVVFDRVKSASLEVLPVSLSSSSTES